MQHKLILFCGSSPGAGKSTMSRLCFQQITAQGIPARWLHEQDMVEAFERFVPGITAGDLTPELLLQACVDLVQWCQVENSVFITDSYLPGFYYLYGRYSGAQIEAYSEDLYKALSSLRPLVVYLLSDVETALIRGVRQRGEQWLENITRYLNGWELPLYGQEPKPLRTVPDVIDFFTRVDRLAVPLLAKWPDMLVLDSSKLAISQFVTTMLDRLALVEHAHEYKVESAELQRYAGTFKTTEGERVASQVEVSLVGETLFINTYWPAGTRLIPEGKGRFHLDGTNRSITFETDVDDQTLDLVYFSGQTIQRYKKQS